MIDDNRTDFDNRSRRIGDNAHEIFAVHFNRRQSEDAALHSISRKSFTLRGVRIAYRLLPAKRELDGGTVWRSGIFGNRRNGRDTFCETANAFVDCGRHNFLYVPRPIHSPVKMRGNFFIVKGIIDAAQNINVNTFGNSGRSC